MRPRNALLALASVVAWFVVVGVAATELASSAIEFSVFVGIPAGLIAGVAAGVLVALGLDEDASPAIRGPAVAIGWFSVAFLVVWLGAVAIGTRMTLSLLAGAAVGTGAAVLSFLHRGLPDEAFEIG